MKTFCAARHQGALILMRPDLVHLSVQAVPRTQTEVSFSSLQEFNFASSLFKKSGVFRGVKQTGPEVRFTSAAQRPAAAALACTHCVTGLSEGGAESPTVLFCGPFPWRILFFCVFWDTSDLAVTYVLFAAVLQPDDEAVDYQMCGYSGVNVKNTSEGLFWKLFSPHLHAFIGSRGFSSNGSIDCLKDDSNWCDATYSVAHKRTLNPWLCGRFSNSRLSLVLQAGSTSNIYAASQSAYKKTLADAI